MLETAVKSLITPLFATISPATKLDTGSSIVKVRYKFPSAVVEPDETVELAAFFAEIVIVGAVLSLGTLIDTVAEARPPFPSTTL